MQGNNHRFLLGFMGCGKTHWGGILSRQLALPFLDLDERVESESGQPIAEIFAEQGEQGFRALEQMALRSLDQQPDSVVATGGGTPCYFDNMDWMNAHGITVYLRTAPAVLSERLRRQTGIRPLLIGIEPHNLEKFIEQKIAEREPFYLKAQHIAPEFETDEELLKWLLQVLGNDILPSESASNLPSSIR